MKLELTWPKLNASIAEMERQHEAGKRKQAEAPAEKERKAREKVDAEMPSSASNSTRRRLAPRRRPDPTECVDLFSGLLPQATVDKLSAEQIAERMRTLFVEREAREHNVTRTG